MARLNPLRFRGVTNIPSQKGAATSATLAGSAAFTTEKWYIGGLIDSAQFRAADPAATYPTAGWFLDVYAFADQPGQVELYGAHSQVTVTAYQLIAPILAVPPSQAFIVQGWRIPCAYFYAVYRNGSSAQGLFNFSVLVRSQ